MGISLQGEFVRKGKVYEGKVSVKKTRPVCEYLYTGNVSGRGKSCIGICL